jgi:hypothetical protein
LTNTTDDSNKCDRRRVEEELELDNQDEPVKTAARADRIEELDAVAEEEEESPSLDEFGSSSITSTPINEEEEEQDYDTIETKQLQKQTRSVRLLVE